MLGCVAADEACGEAVALRVLGLRAALGAAEAPEVASAGFAVVAVFAQAVKSTRASIAIAVLRIIDR
uniref:Exocyst complex component 5 (Exocyst complex component Sec10) n=1 Tax=mine drainage metagenome TaxID=410659 RepID=E6Q1P5_9ZZZZ